MQCNSKEYDMQKEVKEQRIYLEWIIIQLLKYATFCLDYINQCQFHNIFILLQTIGGLQFEDISNISNSKISTNNNSTTKWHCSCISLGSLYNNIANICTALLVKTSSCNSNTKSLNISIYSGHAT